MSDFDPKLADDIYLKPCANCGSTAIDCFSEYDEYSGRNMYYLSCDNCGMQTPKCPKPSCAQTRWEARPENPDPPKTKTSEGEK